MLSPRLLPFVTIAAAALAAAGVACGGNSPEAGESGSPAAPAAATEHPVSTPTRPPTPTPPPRATPTPFAGKVARIALPRFGVDATIVELSVDETNTMESPGGGRENVDVGWYNSELKPGASFLGTRPGWEGNAVFSAHVYYISTSVCPDNPRACPAPFQKLAQSKPGDEIVVTMENGAEYRYKVISYRQYTLQNIPMGEVISPPDRPPGKQWITLITCGGALDASGLEYLSRDVVVAERVS